MRALSVVLFACVFIVAGPAAAASGAVISFDDLTAPGPGGGGLPVNTQYSGQGVTFNDPSAIDYSKGSGAIPGFAHSGSVAVEPCLGAEFCSSPVRATFTAAQQSVGVWVGFSSPLASPLGVRLTAFNASSAVVGTANATLPARATPTSIQTPLSVDLPSATIVRLEVSVTTGGGFTSGLAVDDVGFSTVGPPPPCPATGPPGVEVTRPGGEIEVQNNGFVLEGSVSPNGAPITRASVIAQSPTTRTAQVYPSLIAADGGTFGPVHFNGILSPGQNLVTVTATNCAGTGTSKIQPVTLSPVPAGASFRQIAPIEVTQGVQNATGSVPLVAPSGYGGKRTYARVPLAVDGASTAITGVSATLNAVGENGSRPTGPQIIHSLNTIRVEPGATFADVRSRVDGMLNFELPPEWLTEGKLHLQIDHIEVEGSQTLIPCKGCDNIDADGPSAAGPSFVKFRRSPPLRVQLVSVPFTTSSGTVAPRQLDLDMAASWLRRAYPSADIQIRQAAMPALASVPARCDDVNAALRAWAAPTWHPPTRVYGLYGEPFGAIMGGCSDIGGYFGSGPAGAPRPATSPTDKGFAAWDEDASYADAYGGHEIGHMFNRNHPGACENDTGDPVFPYAGGLLGDFAHDNVGFDGGDPAFSIPTQLYYWNAGSPAHDVMTYCDDQWPSTYTYTHIMDYMCHGYQPYCLNVPVQARPSAAKDPVDRGAGAGKLRLVVNGSLAPGSAKVSLEPLAALRGPGLSIRPRKSPYSILLRGAGDRVVARYPFQPKRVSDQPGKRIDSIQEVVRWKPGTRRVEIAKGKKALAAVQVSAHAPVVSVTGPKKRKLAGPATVRWRARDADGGELTYTLLYSTNGKRFSPVAARLRKRSFRVDPAELGGGPKARFKVIATDGVNTGSDLSRPLKISVKAPRVVLTTPVSGSVLAAKVPVQLVGTVEDLQDLRFADARVVWRSSIQGVLGEGESITATLEPGTHKITLSATNKAGETGSASVEVKAVAAPPDFEAEVVP